MERWEECLAKTRAALASAGYGAALTFRVEHVRYVSPYRPPFSLSVSQRVAALVTPEDLVVFVPQIDAAGLREAAAGRFTVEPLPINQATWGEPLTRAIAERVPSGTVAVDGALATVMAQLRGDLSLDSRPFEEARRIKTPAEVALIRAGVGMVAEAIDAAWRVLRPGMSELELAAVAEHAARAAGAEGFAFFAIVATNGDVARRRFATDYRFTDGDFVFLDLGVVNGGYCAEFSRATVVGPRVSDRQRAIFRAAYRANRAALDLLRPGVRGGAVDAAARAAIHDAGLDEYRYRHVTGSGIGLMLQERPIISDPFDGGLDEVIEPGMVLNVEPGVYHPADGGLRAEDIVLVTEDGCEVISTYPYDERLR
ncbi:MAG TPA: Xaa-Pro peptidase family protein [Thermomicrobiaceae bacterium]|nr:Xaa-Pro peptidase family protein [Thermomicrobiaceae bacterium]